MANENVPNAFTSGTPVLLESRIEILPTTPLSDFSTVGGTVFGARIKGVTESDLLAVVCNKGLIERNEIVNSVRGLNNPGILKLVEAGPVQWPGEDTQYYCLAYERPSVPVMMASLDEVHVPVQEDALNDGFIYPMIGALMALKRSGVVHHAIRPTNIFWRRGSALPPQLGDCLSTPAGVGQSVIFETIERAQCLPMGRGTGHHTDDCYAFGMVLAFMMIGQNPFMGMDDATIIQMKIERGTFATVIGNRRFQPNHIELLRNLLTDDVQQRWTAIELEQWQNGRRATPKKSDQGRRAQRHFEFVGREYWQLRPLAQALYRHVHDAVLIIENGTLDKWLRRSMSDEETAESVVDIQESLKRNSKAANIEDLLVARVCMALDPLGPIRYRGMALMPLGIANMLVDAVLGGRNIQVLSEIIANELVQQWVDMQKVGKADMLPLSQQFDRMVGFLENPTLGNGFERVLYELNPSISCLSPIVRKQYVMAPRFMLTALERIGSSSQRGREPMDRHIAAYLIVRDKRSEKLFLGLSAPEGSIRRGLAMLALFVEMQQRYGPEFLPNIAQWLLPALEGATWRFLGKATRETTLAQVKKTAERGDLRTLQRLLDDPVRFERDSQEFMAARMLYFNIMKEINSLEGQLADRENAARNIGNPMAATLSSFLAIVLAIIILIRAVWKNFV